MPWDINNFLSQLRQGFGPGQEKAAEEQKVQDMQLADEMKLSEQSDKKRREEELFEFKKKKEQLSLLEKIIKLFEPKQPKVKEGQPEPTPTPNPILEQLKKGFEEGFANYSLKSNYTNPLATMSAELAKAAVDNNLPDPYLPATMSLMETSGGKNMTYDNNPFNYGGDKPDLQTAINKVNQSIGSTAGIGTTDANGMGGLYRDYIKSGNMQDFFKIYTPNADPSNPSYDELIDRYTNLRQYFPK
jgi:hypothetical protein